MDSPFANFVKIGIDMSHGKSSVKLPKNWTKLTNSVYNGEPNYAILTGETNGVVVVDIDKKSEAFTGLVWFNTHFGDIHAQDTLVTKTINGGYHVYFQYDPRIKTKLNKSKLHIDILVDKRCAYEGSGYDVICNKPIRALTDSEVELLTARDPGADGVRNVGADAGADTARATSRCPVGLGVLTEIMSTIDISETYDDWMHIGFSLIDFCKQDGIDLNDGLELFKMYSQRNPSKYDESNTIDQWNHWVSRDSERSERGSVNTTERSASGDTDSGSAGNSKITKGTILRLFKNKNEKRFSELKLGSKVDLEILNELDKVSGNSIVKVHEIKHLEIYKKTKASIEAIMKSRGLEPIHDYVSRECSNVQFYSECDRHGYKICCRHCNFEYPREHIPVNKDIAPTVFNLLVNIKDDNISNKDTSQVAKKMISYKNLIYTVDNKWYLYNETSGIYENKNDLEVMNEMENVVSLMLEEGYEEEWFNWVNKINYKENLIKELKVKCFKRVALDNCDFLLGFENGVYDLTSNTFRKGGVDEYVTMKCGVAFESNGGTDESEGLAMEVLKGIFPDPEELQFALNRFCLCLEGYNREQMITFAYGYTASNGKSYLMERLRQALGDYSGTFPVTLLTGKMKGAGEANSSLVEFNKKRFMYCSEPEAGSKLNTNYVKLLTGDKIKARGLYSDKEKEISPTYKIFVCCNALPNFDVYDEGIARRIRLLEYRTRFCDNPKKKNERLLKKYTIEEELCIARGLMKLLIKQYTSLKQNGYKYSEPKAFSSMRKLYLNDNKDVITDLLLENYEQGDDKDYVKLTDIKNTLKQGGIKEKDVISIKKLVEETFSEVEFREMSRVNNVPLRNYFLRLTTKQ